MKRFIFFLLFFLLLQLFFTKDTFASSNFSTDYNVIYTIAQDSLTHVNLNITVTNQSSQYYTPSYEIQSGFKNITNLNASDEIGSLSPKITRDGSGTAILVNFNQRVVGIGNKHILNISFDTDEVAENLNHVWEINIPGLSSKSDFSSFNATVVYPVSLGKPSYIKPAVYPQSYAGNKLTFNKDQLGTSGISITFGSYQIYSFDLVYHLGNSNLFPVKTEIALPPGTNYQDVAIDSIEPKPINVTTDADGNWLAQYFLSPSKRINVEVKGKAKIYLSPKTEPLSNAQIQTYLAAKQYWESNDSKIKSLAKELKTPDKIYDYVVSHLTYDFSRVSSSEPRLGAVGVLNSPGSAVCLEFTDLFIAISRAAGIPAREIDGYAYTKNTQQRPLSLVSDILHAWPQYYDFGKKEWISVDPTWGNTTGGVDYFNVLDFDHFAFVVKGQNSSYPVPAGGYKMPQDKDLKDVTVDIGDNFSSTVNVSPDITIQNPVFAGFPTDVTITVKNTGNSLADSGNFQVATDFLKPTNQTIYFQKIPPFGFVSIPIRYGATAFLTNDTDAIKITFGNKIYSQDIRILPIFLYKGFLIFGGAFLIVVCVILSIIIYRSRRIPISQSGE